MQCAPMNPDPPVTRTSRSGMGSSVIDAAHTLRTDYRSGRSSGTTPRPPAADREPPGCIALGSREVLVGAFGLRPTDARCGCGGGQHLTGAWSLGQPSDVVGEAVGHAPVCCQHEQRLSVLAAEHAREAGPVEPDSLERLATFADPADKVVAELTDTRPDRTSGVHADPIWANAVGPYPPV